MTHYFTLLCNISFTIWPTRRFDARMHCYKEKMSEKSPLGLRRTSTRNKFVPTCVCVWLLYYYLLLWWCFSSCVCFIVLLYPVIYNVIIFVLVRVVLKSGHKCDKKSCTSPIGPTWFNSPSHKSSTHRQLLFVLCVQ